MARGRVRLNRVAEVPDIDKEISGARRLPEYGFQARGAERGVRSSAEQQGELHRCVMQACVTLGRSDQVDHVMAYLQREWLTSVVRIASLTEAGWSELQLPVGLKEELKHNLGIGPVRAAGNIPPMMAWEPAVSSTAPPPKLMQERPSTAAARGPSFGLDGLQPPTAGFSNESKTVDKEAEQVINRLRAFVRKKGGGVLKSIGAKFRQVDIDESGGISKSEFQEALVRVMGDFPVTEDEVALLWRHLDANGNGIVDFEEFLMLLTGGLTAKRREAVRMCFRYLDKSGNGMLDIEDLKMRYDPSPLSQASPHLLMGPRPSTEELRRFLENFRKAVGGHHPEGITAAEFERYYEKVSAGIDSDEYFEAMLQRSWCLPEGYTRPGPFTIAPQRQGGGRFGGSNGASLLARIRAALVQSPVGIDRLVPIYSMARPVMPYMSVEVFARFVALLCPELLEKDLGLLAVLFAEEDGVNVPLFIQALLSRARFDTRASALATMFLEVRGAQGGEELNLQSLQKLPRIVLGVYQGERSMSVAEWLDFHLTIGVGLPDDQDFEKQVRQMWDLSPAPPPAVKSSTSPGVGYARPSVMPVASAPAPVGGSSCHPRADSYPGYYKNRSTVQLG